MPRNEYESGLILEICSASFIEDKQDKAGTIAIWEAAVQTAATICRSETKKSRGIRIVKVAN